MDGPDSFPSPGLANQDSCIIDEYPRDYLAIVRVGAVYSIEHWTNDLVWVKSSMTRADPNDNLLRRSAREEQTGQSHG